MRESTPRAVPRRAIIAGALWAAPVVLVAATAASAAGSTPLAAFTVLAVRSDGPAWVGTGNNAPGFRFGVTGSSASADLTILKASGPIATFATIFTKYQGYATFSQSSPYLDLNIPMVTTETVGVTINNVDAAVGTYSASIAPHGGAVMQTAFFEIYKEGAEFRVSPTWR